MTVAAVVRLQSDGVLDPSFGFGGELITNFFGTDTTVAEKVAIDSQNRITIAGEATYDSTGQTALIFVRYTDNGSYDTTFGGSGGVGISGSTVSLSATLGPRDSGVRLPRSLRRRVRESMASKGSSSSTATQRHRHRNVGFRSRNAESGNGSRCRREHLRHSGRSSAGRRRRARRDPLHAGRKL